MRLTKREKILLLGVAYCSSMSTPAWRDYVPLSNRGLVELDDSDGVEWKRVFGASVRSVRATPKGKAVADDVQREVSLWHAIANEHQTDEWIDRNRMRRPDGTPKVCLCWACLAAFRMRPVAT